MRVRIGVSISVTILFAASWCLSETSDNVFWLCLSRKTYLNHIGIWLAVCLFIFLMLSLVGKLAPQSEKRFMVFLFVLSPLNLLDFGMRSIFGAVREWSDTVLISWSVMTLLLVALAVYMALRANISYGVLKKAIQVCVIPCLLLIYYALPTEFTTLRVEKPPHNGNRPPIHLILFDMLSYDFMFMNNKVKTIYSNFESFSNEAEVYVNAYSTAGCTGEAIPRLLTGIDFAETGRTRGQWTGKAENASKMQTISSFKTIFSTANKNGYNVFLRAFALPYLDNFGEHIQSGRVHPFDTLWKVGMHGLIWPVLFPGGIAHQETARSMLNDYINRIAKGPFNTFFYTHWNIPHDPFIYDSNGNMLTKFRLRKRLITRPPREIGYKHQLKGTDRVFGELIQAMKLSRSYDKSLVIVTSDHNIQGFDFNMKHIPLFVKRPYQRNTRIIESHVTSLSIYRYVEHFIQFGNFEKGLLK